MKHTPEQAPVDFPAIRRTLKAMGVTLRSLVGAEVDLRCDVCGYQWIFQISTNWRNYRCWWTCERCRRRAAKAQRAAMITGGPDGRRP